MSRPTLAVVTAAFLWFWMFSPWTAGLFGFWPSMAVASVVLLLFAAPWQGRGAEDCPVCWARQFLLGIAIATLLWGVFWVGDRLSSLWFDFARPQVDAVYGMKGSMPSWLIALQLLLLTGPAEELFWRGYVQRTLSLRWNANVGFLVTTALYTLIHLWSFNFMLIMAALTCGLVWGGLYRFKPQWLPALVVSHALWDTAVFVIFPI